jgi:hypothetical protein
LILHLKAVTVAAEGDSQAAIGYVTELVNLGRSYGDEPLTASQAIRLAILETVVTCIEQVLMETELSAETLQSLVQMLEDEERSLAQILLNALRGERAFNYWIMQSTIAGQDERLLREFNSTIREIQWREGAILAFSTEYVEAAKLKWSPDQYDLFEDIDKRIMTDPSSAHCYALLNTSLIFHCRVDDVRMKLRAALVALACEKYRIRNGRWPTALAELVATRCVAKGLVDSSRILKLTIEPNENELTVRGWMPGSSVSTFLRIPVVDTAQSIILVRATRRENTLVPNVEIALLNKTKGS